MQFSQSISSYIDRRAVNFAHEQFDSGSNLVNSITNVEDYALIGGGKVRSTAIYKEHLSLISYFTNPRSKSVSVEIDEYSIN